MEKFIVEKLEEGLVIKLFGKPYSVLKVDFDKEKTENIKQFGKNPSLVKVLGFKTAGMCSRFDSPKILLLPGEGENPNDCGFENDTEVKMWKLDTNFNSLLLDTTPFNLKDLLESQSDAKKGLSLSAKLKNCSYKNGVFRGNLEIKIEIVFVRIKETIPIEINIGVSNTVNIYSDYLGPFFVTIDLALKATNKACARLTVDYSGIRANEEVCANF